jgi:signal transduction histidine kinase/ligand-binding sensor domain-containing protein
MHPDSEKCFFPLKTQHSKLTTSKKMIRAIATTLCALLLVPHVITAQATTPPTAHARFERINTSNGLSNNEITCIFQDRDGFMWFGTADGLNKYDGYTMTVYRSDDARPWTTIPSNQINAITQDELGNIWVGTQSGVAILDHQTQVWERFPRGVKDSLGKPIAYFAALMTADKTGRNIWLQSTGGFSRFDVRSKFHTVYYNPKQDPQESYYKPHLLKPDSIIIVSNSSWPNVFQVGFGADSNVYFEGGEFFNTADIVRFDSAKNGFVTVIQQYHPSRRNALADDGEYFWFGIEQPILNEKGVQLRLVRANKRTGAVEILPTIGTPFAACVVGDEVWFGVFNGGIKRVSRATKQLLGAYTHNPTDATSLPSNMVTALYRDRTGCVWAGTGESGIAKLTLSRITTLTQNFLDTTNLPSSIVQAVCEDSSGTLWVGTRKGLCCIERGTGKTTTYQRQHPVQPKHINDIVALALEHSATHPWRNKHLWVASWGMGVQLFDIAERRFSLPPQPVQVAASNFPITGWSNTILQIAPDSLMFNNWGTHFWTLDLSHPEAINTFISRDEAFSNFRYKQGMKLYTEIVAGLNHIIIKDREGTLWAGGEGGGALDACGLFRKKKGENWKLIATAMRGDSTLLPSYIIHAIYESTRGDLWLGTADGLCRFDRKTLRIRRFVLPNNVVLAIQEDAHGNLWCGTAKGIVQFDPAREVVVRVLRPVDGLPSWSFNRGASMKSRLTGELFFGTNESLCWFHPDSLQTPLLKPLVAFTKCAITREDGTDSTLAVLAGTAHFADGAIELSHRDKGFSFEMAALDFKSPADNEYAYKLDGFDKDWNSTGTRRFANYTSLPDGVYTLRIKAANADGVWNEAATTLRIRVKPPFWRTWWFIALSLVMGISSVVGTTRFIAQRTFKRDLALATERLEAAQALDTERLQREIALEKERGRISQDLHDEVGPSITKILMLSNFAASASTHESPPMLDKGANLADTAQEVIKAMAGVIWLTKPENDTLESLISYLREHTTDYLATAQIGCRVDIPDTIPERTITGIVRRNVFLTAKEALNNIAKHAHASEVQLGVAVTPSTLHIRICDNGRGFAPDDTRRFGNGLRNMQRRMEECGGSCCLESSVDAGTEIVLEVAL